MVNWKQTDSLIERNLSPSQTSKSLIISQPAVYLAIVYKHEGSIRRTIFFDEDLTLLSSESMVELKTMLPGLHESIYKIFSMFKHADTQYLCDNSIFLTSASRGSQSFAFGHFIIDILPYLFYAKLIESFNSYTPLLYQREEWQQNLLETCFEDPPKLKYFEDITSFFSTPFLDAYKLKSRVVDLPRCKHALFVLQRVITSKSQIATSSEDSKNKDILFLMRKNIAGRSDRWSNADYCFSSLQKRVTKRIIKINPSEHLPSEIAKYAGRTSLTITAAGSAAYNSLLFGNSNHLTILVVPYLVDSAFIWNLTLRMFIPFSNRLVLMSAINAPEPSSKAWDSNIALDPNDFSKAILELQDLSPPITHEYPDISKRRIYSVSSLVINLPT